MMLKLYPYLILTILSFILGMANAASLSTDVDRPIVQLGETFTLTLTLTDTAVNDPPPPNFNAIERHFNILATYFQTSIVRTHQNTESKSVWKLTLEPRSVGDFLIPKLSIASLQTSPIKITVSAPSKTAVNMTDLPPLFLETSVNTQTPSIKSEIIYTLKMLYSKPMQNIILAPPKIPQGIVYPLPGQKTYRSIVRQQAYHVIEQRYAIFPLKSGPLVIKGPRLTGQMKNTTSTSKLDSTAWENVTHNANDIILDVKPEIGPIKSWLPAQKLTLSSHWSSPTTQLKVGEPVTLTITLEAIGLPGTELPDVSQWRVPEVLRQNILIRTSYDSEHIVGKRVHMITLLPRKPGQLMIPAYELQWWNIQTKQLETAKIPAKTWQVLGPARASPQPLAAAKTQELKIQWYQNPWAWASMILAIVNLGSIGYYRRRIRHLSSNTDQVSMEN